MRPGDFHREYHPGESQVSRRTHPLNLSPHSLPNSATDDTAPFDASMAHACALAARGDYQDATGLLNLALQQCPASDIARRAQALALLAHHYPRLGNLQASARCASEAVALGERLGEQTDGALVLADALCALAYVYAQLLMCRDALECSLRALAVARKAADPLREGWALNRVGVAYVSLGNLPQSCETITQALEIAQVLTARGLPGRAGSDAHELHFSCLNNLAYFWLNRMGDAARQGEAVLLRQSRDEALRCSEAATSLARSSNSPFQVAVAVSNLVEALLGRADYAAAEPLLREFKSLSDLHGYQALALQAVTQRALMLKAQGDFAGATAGLLALLDAADSKSNELPPKLKRLLLRSLYETHKASGNYREALGFLEQHVELERLIARDTMALQTEVMMIRQEVEQARARAEHAQQDALRERARSQHLEREQQRLHEHAAALDRAAHEDVLTGLHNRRHAEFALALLVEGARQLGKPISLGLLDVDHFKRINDSFGHAVGDKVLQQLAQLLRSAMRSADLLARVGGEEFLVVLVGMTPSAAQEVCERLRLAVAAHDWSSIRPGLAVRISMGLAGGTPPLEAQTLLDRADKALYAAKAAGRNQVRLEGAV